MEEKFCKGCKYEDIKNVCLNVKSKYFLCKTDLLNKDIFDCSEKREEINLFED